MTPIDDIDEQTRNEENTKLKYIIKMMLVDVFYYTHNYIFWHSTNVVVSGNNFLCV